MTDPVVDYRRVFAAGVACMGLAALCQCSLVFGLDGLNNGGRPGIDAGDDAPSSLGAPGDEGGRDVAGEVGGFDAARDTSGMVVDAESDVASSPDAESDTDAGADAHANGLDTGVVGVDAAGLDAAGLDGALFDAPGDSGTLAVGLVAFYPFDETSGTTATDVSGNKPKATMRGATFTSGLRGNAATLDGTTQYVSLPLNIVSGLTAFSVSAWVYPSSALLHAHVFDIGTGMTAYMFLTPGTSILQYAITTSAVAGEQHLNAASLATGSWQHVAVTLKGTTGTLYVNGAQVSQNTSMTITPASLGNTTQNWLGRSADPVDPYFNGKIDQLRIYNRALTPSEVQQLFLLQQ